MMNEPYEALAIWKTNLLPHPLMWQVFMEEKMIKEMQDFIARFTYRPVQQRVAKKIRQKAIQQTQARLAVHHQTFADYQEEELEIIIEDEERKIIDSLKTKSILAILSLLGISLFP